MEEEEAAVAALRGRLAALSPGLLAELEGAAAAGAAAKGCMKGSGSGAGTPRRGVRNVQVGRGGFASAAALLAAVASEGLRGQAAVEQEGGGEGAVEGEGQVVRDEEPTVRGGRMAFEPGPLGLQPQPGEGVGAGGGAGAAHHQASGVLGSVPEEGLYSAGTETAAGGDGPRAAVGQLPHRKGSSNRPASAVQSRERVCTSRPASALPSRHHGGDAVSRITSAATRRTAMAAAAGAVAASSGLIEAALQRPGAGAVMQALQAAGAGGGGGGRAASSHGTPPGGSLCGNEAGPRPQGDQGGSGPMSVSPHRANGHEQHQQERALMGQVYDSGLCDGGEGGLEGSAPEKASWDAGREAAGVVGDAGGSTHADRGRQQQEQQQEQQQQQREAEGLHGHMESLSGSVDGQPPRPQLQSGSAPSPAPRSGAQLGEESGVGERGEGAGQAAGAGGEGDRVREGSRDATGSGEVGLLQGGEAQGVRGEPGGGDSATEELLMAFLREELGR